MKKQIFFPIIGIFLRSLLVFAWPLDAFAQTNNCPVEIRKKNTSLCNGSQAPGFYMKFDEPYVGNNYTFTFNFGPNTPSECQTMTFQPTTCNNVLVDNQSPYCHFTSPTGTMTMPGGNTSCYYQNGNLVSQQNCSLLLPDCNDPLLGIAKNFIKDDPACKFWDGPCATDGEIWRSGYVLLGTNELPPYSDPPPYYQLSVKGGITTEMLQICIPEWCDYVFADTFQLMPLADVRAFIQTNHRLPDCTPATVIEQEGISIGDETVNQQKKIEEIFLHLIAAQKRLDGLDKRIPGSSVVTEHQAPPPQPGAENPPPAPLSAQITCAQLKPAPTGTAAVIVSPDSGPYNVSWSGPSSGQMTGVVCNGAINIIGLSAGNYNVTVSNSGGTLGVCSFSITTQSVDCGIFDDPACKEAIINLIEDELFSTPPSCKQWEGDECSHSESIYRLGNVAIGTSVGHAGFSLAVKGGIVTTKFRIELCETSGWCDYVFDEDYPLPSLYEVESFIQQYRHLPGTVTQQEVTRDGGFEMRSAKLDHQEKIEEAYLYLIEMNSKKKDIENKINVLSEQY